VPERAIVPKLSASSCRSIPIPLSETVIVLASSSSVTVIRGSKLRVLKASSETVRYLSLSIASDAFETSSRKKTSLCE